MTNFTTYIIKALIAAFGGVGIMEWLKNFIKTTKTWIYSLLMPFVAICCYFSIEYLPPVFFGSIMTIGIMQVDYQIIIQGLKKIGKTKIKDLSEKGEANE